ncbi:MAG TPA: hypothetical protein VF177_01825 [Anaerolineae bacterium]
MFVILLISLLMVGVISAVRVAYATIPDAGGVIHACYDPGNRMLRVIDTEAGEVCRPQDGALSWNQTGPQGPEGLRGPSDGYVVRLLPFEAKNLDNQNVNVLSLSLPAGDYIVSASVRVDRTQPGTSSVFCDLRVGGGPFPTGYHEVLDGTDAVATMAATSGLSLPSAEMVHLTCEAIGDDGTFATLAGLTAIRVGTLTRQ